MKRVTWFIGGVVTGAAGVGYAKRTVKRTVKRTATQLAPSNVARGTLRKVRRRAATSVARSARAAMRCAPASASCGPRRDGRIETLDEQLGPDDQLLSTASRSRPHGSSCSVAPSEVRQVQVHHMRDTK